MVARFDSIKTRRIRPYLKKETAMSNPYTETDYRNELRAGHTEPLLPIEKKLIAWSLGIGLVLLVVLAAVNHFYPPGT